MFSIPTSVCLLNLEKVAQAKVDRRPALAGSPRIDEAYAAHPAIVLRDIFDCLSLAL